MAPHVETSPCQCGCGEMTVLTRAADPCSCGCECCQTESLSKEEEIVQLETLREAVSARLEEIASS